MRTLAAVLYISVLALTYGCVQKTGPEPSMANATEKDLVCGMKVDPATSEKASYQGKNYYFCSREDREEFQKNPEKFIKPAAQHN